MTTRIGFVGLGTMGAEITRRLLAAGYPMTVWNRTAATGAPLIEAGAKWAESPAAVASACDVVFTMVTDAPASESVIFGANGIMQGAKPGLIIIDSASIAPDASIANAARCNEAGVMYLDAPVSGGPKVAAEGKLGVMVGGDAVAYKMVEPILQHIGTKVLHAGAPGSGTTLKQIANLIMGVAIQACAEALVLAAKIGINPQVVIDITSLPGTGPQTGAMNTRGPRMINHNFFPPHFSAANMHKDLTGALLLAEKHGVSLPTASAAREMLRAVKSQGNGHIDSSAVVTVLEAMANTSVPRAAGKAV
jgi:3-hydroxyisobutyrate dehydrogenase-like beta-hydroxyacid dehydrogenase